MAEDSNGQEVCTDADDGDCQESHSLGGEAVLGQPGVVRLTHLWMVVGTTHDDVAGGVRSEVGGGGWQHRGQPGLGLKDGTEHVDAVQQSFGVFLVHTNPDAAAIPFSHSFSPHSVTVILQG